MDISTHTGYHTDTYRGTPYRIRTGVAAVKGQCPRPLDEGCLLLAPVERIELPSWVLETPILPLYYTGMFTAVLDYIVLNLE